MARGISSGTLGIVIVAIVAGLIGAYVVRTSLLKEPEVVAKAPTRVTVPLAAADLPAGRTLTLGDIGLVSMTRAEMETQGFPLDQTMMSPDQIIGRTLREPVKQGQPFITTGMYLEGTRQDYTAELPPGYRAISMPIAKDRGGALPNGSMVDVFFRSTERKPAGPNDRGIPEVTLQLLQGIKIIDVYEPPVAASGRTAGLDLRVSPSRTPPPPLVTLAVTPEQAQILQTASGRGEITLVARPENERLASATPLRGKTLDDLLGIEPPPQIVVFTTEAYRRGSRSVNVYRDDRLVEELRATAPPASNNGGAAVDTPATDKPVPASPFAPPAGNDNANPATPPSGDAPAAPPQPPAHEPAKGALGLQRTFVPMTAGTSR